MTERAGEKRQRALALRLLRRDASGQRRQKARAPTNADRHVNICGIAAAAAVVATAAAGRIGHEGDCNDSAAIVPLNNAASLAARRRTMPDDSLVRSLARPLVARALVTRPPLTTSRPRSSYGRRLEYAADSRLDGGGRALRARFVVERAAAAVAVVWHTRDRPVGQSTGRRPVATALMRRESG